MPRFATSTLLAGAIMSLAAALRAEPQIPVENVLGYWLTEKQGAVIEIDRCEQGKGLCGRIAWLREPYTDAGELKRDPENPDASLRDRPLCGMQVVTNLTRIDGDTWAYGRVYNPEDGNDYRAYLDAQEDGTVDIRGYIGIPLLGKSETWTRPGDIDIGCPQGNHSRRGLSGNDRAG